MATPAPAARVARRACAAHPDRPAHAMCMACGRPVCSECATDWDGVYHCTRCLARKGTGARRGAPWLSWTVVALSIPALAWIAARLMVWVGVLVASL